MSRREIFHDNTGNPILGYSTDDGTVCRDCASNNVEMVDVDPRATHPIHFDDLGERVEPAPRGLRGMYQANPYPDGFTCVGCGDTIGSWDYKGDRSPSQDLLRRAKDKD